MFSVIILSHVIYDTIEYKRIQFQIYLLVPCRLHKHNLVGIKNAFHMHIRRN